MYVGRWQAVLAAIMVIGCSDTSGEPGGAAGAAASNPCGIATDFPGDEACLAPPHPSEGMQIHVGPSNYDDPEEVRQFLLEPGDESSECWSLHTPNTTDVYFQSFELRGRPGTHHIINTTYRTELADGGFTSCRDPGIGQSPDILDTLPSASRPDIARSAVAPENAGIAQFVPARTPMQADMHYFNTGTGPVLREFWLNLYYVNSEQVTDSPRLIRGMGGVSWNAAPIPPHTRNVYAYSCAIEGDGRILSLFGHTHAHGIRETAWIRRTSGERQKVFEQYDYLDPQMFNYDSVTTNPEFSETAAGAHTGILEVSAGDALDWECEVDNDTDRGLTYTNDVFYGEMCNIWGQTVGSTINCVLP